MTSNPLDDLRQINRQQREALNSPDNKDGRTDGSTGLREDGRTDGRTDGSTGLREDGRTDGRTDGSTGLREDGKKGKFMEEDLSASLKNATALPTDLVSQVRETLSEKRVYQGGVKTTLDIAPDLSTRFKRYSIDNHNVTLRQLMTELLNAYLSGEGY